jgi:hypothetical protein
MRLRILAETAGARDARAGLPAPVDRRKRTWSAACFQDETSMPTFTLRSARWRAPVSAASACWGARARIALVSVLLASNIACGHISVGDGGSAPCVESFFDLAVDQGSPMHLTSACQVNTPLPTGAFAGLVPAPYHPAQTELELAACVTADAGAQGIVVTTTGTFVAGAGAFLCSATYADPAVGGFTSDQTQSPRPCTLTVTQLGDVGGVVEGTLKAQVALDMAGPFHQLSGSFHVCRAGDVGP